MVSFSIHMLHHITSSMKASPPCACTWRIPSASHSDSNSAMSQTMTHLSAHRVNSHVSVRCLRPFNRLFSIFAYLYTSATLSLSLPTSSTMSIASASFDDARTLRLDQEQQNEPKQPLPPSDEKVDPYLVSFGPDDPANPQVLNSMLSQDLQVTQTISPSTELVEREKMVDDDSGRYLGAECVRRAIRAVDALTYRL